MKLTINKLTIQLENKKRKSFKIWGEKFKGQKKDAVIERTTIQEVHIRLSRNSRKRTGKGKKTIGNYLRNHVENFPELKKDCIFKLKSF